MMLPWKVVRTILVLILALAVFLLMLWRTGWLRPTWSTETIRQSIVTTLQSEAPASFLVTGMLTVTATATITDTRYLMPDILDLNLGTTEAIVRLPGRVAYGIDVSSLREEDVDVREDGSVLVRVPELRVFSVEPDLHLMEVSTTVGWARLYRRSGRSAEREAVLAAEDALRRQAERHLAEALQPRVNTAEALERLLVPVLKSAGVDDPTIEIQVGPALETAHG